ncbi:hypothetical protein BASA81_001770 [Batrachochytrium salamandrivorans]|nr:hypothetical protein BASA81_001770 [Batrachochytrium salamandrivorans]
MPSWTVGDAAEVLDSEHVWNEVSILRLGKTGAYLNFTGQSESANETRPVSDLKPLGTHTKRRKCLYNSSTPAVALLRRAEDTKGEAYLKQEAKLAVYLVEEKRYEWVDPVVALASFGTGMGGDNGEKWGDAQGDEFPMSFVQGTLSMDMQAKSKRHNTRFKPTPKPIAPVSESEDDEDGESSEPEREKKGKKRDSGKRKTRSGKRFDSSSAEEEDDGEEEEEVEEEDDEAEKVPRKRRKPTPVVATAATVAAAKKKKEEPTLTKKPLVASTVVPRRRQESAKKQQKRSNNKAPPPHAALQARYKRFAEKLQEEESSSSSGDSSNSSSNESSSEGDEEPVIDPLDTAEGKLKFLQHRVQLFCEDDSDEDGDNEYDPIASYISKQPQCITLQSIALLGYLRLERSQGVMRPSLVIVPLAVLANWEREFTKWCPKLVVYSVHTPESRSEMLKQKDVDVFLTTFEVVKLEKSRFKRLGPWNFIVLDEAHKVKNDESELSKVCREMDSQFRLLLTGTPLQNNFHELWSLLNFLIPQLFDDARMFEFQTVSVEELKTEQVRELLRSILQPFLLRRLKSDTTKEIPPKREIKLFCGMSEMQSYWYKQILTKNAETLTQLNASNRGLQNILMQLRKVCNHPYLFDGAEPGPPFIEGAHMVDNCGKMVLLDKLLRRLQENGDRVLIFSQMTQMLDILEDYCTWRQYECCRIDGSTKIAERYELIDQFNSPESKKFCFLLSTRAGGLGINLQTANVVILFDSDWNPFVDLQAQDRAHRIGQTKEVTVFRLITENTIEEKIVERAEHKLFLDAVVVQQHAAKLSKEVLASAVCFGADAIFRSNSSTITDEDIDTILERGKQRSLKFTEGVQLTLGSFQATDTKIGLKEQQNELKRVLAPVLKAQTEVLGKRKSRNQVSFTSAYGGGDDDDDPDDSGLNNGANSSNTSSSSDGGGGIGESTMNDQQLGAEKKPRAPRKRKKNATAAVSTTTAVLPPGWRENVAPDSGRTYYFNTHTREATFVFPTQAAVALSVQQQQQQQQKLLGAEPDAIALADEARLPAGWKRAVEQPSGRVYYYNVDTLKSTWVAPVLEDMEKLQRQMLEEQQRQFHLQQLAMQQQLMHHQQMAASRLQFMQQQQYVSQPVVPQASGAVTWYQPQQPQQPIYAAFQHPQYVPQYVQPFAAPQQQPIPPVVVGVAAERGGPAIDLTLSDGE